jgi:hypothetical protein
MAFRRGRLYSLRRRLEIADCSLEASLIGVVIFPAAEVADVAIRQQLGRPSLVGVHHDIVETDRKQDGLSALAFLFVGCVYFILDPIALDRMFGQDQQQLVPQPDRAIDLVEDFSANSQIVRREPAAPLRSEGRYEGDGQNPDLCSSS